VIANPACGLWSVIQQKKSKLGKPFHQRAVEVIQEGYALVIFI
jgi:hypothetical protein